MSFTCCFARSRPLLIPLKSGSDSASGAGIPTGITQNVKDLLASQEVENILENSDFICMLNQASGDREILAKKLGISPYQLSYVTQSGEGEGLLFYGNVILPFQDHFPKNTLLYKVMTTKLSDKAVQNEH